VISLLAKLLSVLNSDTKPSQIALAIALALLVGFNGVVSSIGLLVILLLFVVRCNLTIFLAFTAVFAVLGKLFSFLTHLIGEAVLTAEGLQSLLTDLYQTYWFRLDELNNTVEMGDLIFSVVAFVPVYFISIIIVNKYRISLMGFANKFKVVQTLKASKFYRIYAATQS